MTPPISGPAAAPIPPSPLITPNAHAREVRSWNHNVARMYTGGIRNAVPMPSNTELPRISTPRFGESALIKAPMPYSVRTPRKHRLRPQRSVSLLHGIIRTAMISRNNVITVCTPLTVVSRSSLMSLIITFMFEPAKLQMNWASARGRINFRAETTGRSGVRSWPDAIEFSVTRHHHRNAGSLGGIAQGCSFSCRALSVRLDARSGPRPAPQLGRDFDPPPREGVDPPPAPGNVEQGKEPDVLGQRRVDDEVVALWLEAEHRAEQEQRCSGRPGLRAARRRVLHRVLRHAPLVTAERLRQPSVEELGRVEDAGGNDGGLVLEAVAAQAPGDERAVEGPNGADVVPD